MTDAPRNDGPTIDSGHETGRIGARRDRDAANGGAGRPSDASDRRYSGPPPLDDTPLNALKLSFTEKKRIHYPSDEFVLAVTPLSFLLSSSNWTTTRLKLDAVEAKKGTDIFDLYVTLSVLRLAFHFLKQHLRFTDL